MGDCPVGPTPNWGEVADWGPGQPCGGTVGGVPAGPAPSGVGGNRVQRLVERLWEIDWPAPLLIGVGEADGQQRWLRGGAIGVMGADWGWVWPCAEAVDTRLAGLTPEWGGGAHHVPWPVGGIMGGWLAVPDPNQSVGQ